MVVKSSLKTKIFIGYELPVDLKFHLKHNKIWKIASAGNELNDENIVEQPFNGKNYLGFILDCEMISLKSINEKATQLLELIQGHAPDVNWSKKEIHVFSQVFLT